MNKEKISIIISAYNTEKYVEKALDSIIAQSYENLEIVVVDDCSKDNTLKILEKYAKKDKRIKLLKNEVNKGLAYSRNRAVKESTGKYLGFIDSDDYIPQNYYEELYKSLISEKADIAVCDFNIVYENKDNMSVLSPACTGKVNALNIINQGLAAACCNKLIKRENFIYQFEVGKVNEDVAVIIPTLASAKKISYTNKTLYNYVQRENSIQNSSFSNKKFDIFDGVSLALERIKGNKYYSEIKDMLVYNQLVLLLLYVIPKDPSLFKRSKYIKEFVKKYQNYSIFDNKYFNEFLNNSGRKTKYYYKLYVWFAFHHLPMFSSLLVWVYQIYKKITTKNVIEEDITYETLELMAKKHQKLKENKVKVTAVIPNYNYEKFLKQRVYSILYQTKKIEKLLILDDCSTDNSKEEIEKIKKTIEKYVPVEIIYNEKNSGSAFKQWAKGIKHSTSDYVWICEADDYCTKDFLEKVTKPIIKNENIVISYGNTSFIDAKGEIIYKNIIPQIDLLNTKHWNKNYINDGISEVENYTYLNCTIPNVSGVIIRKDNYTEEFKRISTYKQAGDWLFYASIMKRGKIAFTKKVLNYYRVHGNNISTVTKKEAHMKEIKDIHKFIRENYKLDKNCEKEIKNRYKFLSKVWNLDN